MRASITASEFRASPLKTPRQRKFRNIPTVVDGMRFDSKREAARWGELKLLERVGELSDLQRQVRFDLIVNGVHVAAYIADMVYLDHSGRRVIEDVKSDATRKDPVYRLKAKLMAVLHQPIVEV